MLISLLVWTLCGVQTGTTSLESMGRRFVLISEGVTAGMIEGTSERPLRGTHVMAAGAMLSQQGMATGPMPMEAPIEAKQGGWHLVAGEH